MPDYAELKDITQNGFQHLTAPFELDLLAYFRIIEQEVMKIYANAENMTEDQILSKIDDLFK